MAYQYVREPLTAAEADRLANACQTPTERLVVWTLLDIGLRISELCGLTARHVLGQQRQRQGGGEPRRADQGGEPARAPAHLRHDGPAEGAQPADGAEDPGPRPAADDGDLPQLHRRAHPGGVRAQVVSGPRAG